MRQAAQTMMVGLFLVVSSVAPLSAAATDAAGTIAQAKRLVEAKNYAQAATLLEDLLAEADARQRRSILELLRQSYEAMAREAKAAGNDREAAHLLDNIAIIDQSRGQARARGKIASKQSRCLPRLLRNRQVAKAQNIAAPLDVGRIRCRNHRSKPLPSARSRFRQPQERRLGAHSAFSGPAKNASRSKTHSFLRRTSGPSTEFAAGEPNPAPKPPAVSLAEGDRLFGERRYDEAGRCYAALARQNRLPAYRKQHWAYCRMVEVARRINLRPQSAQEWDEIAAEIGNIQRLTPNIWYGEYLRNKVAEVRRSGRRPLAKSDNLVVRGSAPDETQSQAQARPRVAALSPALW